MIMENIGSEGSIDTHKVACVVLSHGNCLDLGTSLIMAQIVLGRVLQDHISFTPSSQEVHQH